MKIGMTVFKCRFSVTLKCILIFPQVSWSRKCPHSHEVTCFHMLFTMSCVFNTVDHFLTNLCCFSSYHLVARAKACVNDYRAALVAEKTAFAIYSSKVMSLCWPLFLFSHVSIFARKTAKIY